MKNNESDDLFNPVMGILTFMLVIVFFSILFHKETTKSYKLNLEATGCQISKLNGDIIDLKGHKELTTPKGSSVSAQCIELIQNNQEALK